MYYDDYECCNPLGSHSGVHKLGAVYFSLGGIPPKYASRLENILFWGLFYSSDRAAFGSMAIFKKFVQQLQNLELNDIEIVLIGKSETVYFTLLLLLGDNLGVNSISGFQESFSANYCCRFCCADKNTLQKQCLENELLLRNKVNYAEHLSAMSHGIKAPCIFNDLNYFHVVQNISCDIMHDLLEGVRRYDMAKILNLFIYKKEYFTLQQLNSRIKYFDYNQFYDVGNRIPTILEAHIKKGVLIMSSAEMMAFVIYFSILFKKGCVIHTGYFTHEHAKLAVIHTVICKSFESIYFFCNLLKIPEIEPSIKSYSINMLSDNFIYVNLKDLATFKSLWPHLLPSDKRAITLFNIK